MLFPAIIPFIHPFTLLQKHKNSTGGFRTFVVIVPTILSSFAWGAVDMGVGVAEHGGKSRADVVCFLYSATALVESQDRRQKCGSW